MRPLSLLLFALALLPLLVPACSAPPDPPSGGSGGSGGSTAAPGGTCDTGGNGGSPPNECPALPDWTPPNGIVMGGECCYRLIPCLTEAQNAAYEAACNPASVAPLRNALLCTGVPASNDCYDYGEDECGMVVACCLPPF